MPKYTAAIAALVALAAGIIGNIDPLTNVQRAALAYLLGWLSYQVWNAFIVGVAGVIPQGSNVSNSSTTKENTTSEKLAA